MRELEPPKLRDQVSLFPVEADRPAWFYRDGKLTNSALSLAQARAGQEALGS